MEKVKVVNTIDCGDAFSADFLYEYFRTKSVTPNIQKALEKGNWCAARNAECEKVGSIE